MFKWLKKDRNKCDDCEYNYVEAIRKNTQSNERLNRALRERQNIDEALSSLVSELK